MHQLRAVAMALAWIVVSSPGLVPEASPADAQPLAASFAEVAVPQVTQRPSPPPPPPDGPVAFVDELSGDAVELAFGGDVNLGRRVGDVIRARGADWVWDGVDELLGAADLAVVNLECTVSRRGTPLDKEFTFRADPDVLPAMVDAGVDIVNLGNNHAVDYGRTALRDTLGHLADAGILAVGAGEDADEAFAARFVEVNGIRFGFVGATRVLPHHFAAGPGLPGVASAYDEARLVRAVAEASAGSDVVVVSVHWGRELATQPDGVQRHLARLVVDAGADIVIGHHPHVLQPVERLDGAVVAWSLGNFVFSSGSVAGTTTMLLRVGVRPNLEFEVAAVPLRILGTRPVPVGA